jgi:UDP-glucuronate 4-epimerase
MGFNKILVTGAAGFIGHHTALRLAKDGYQVTGIDNLNTYYDVMLKRARLIEAGISLAGQPGRVVSSRFDRLTFQRLDLTDDRALTTLFKEEKFDAVIHMAAQSGMKYSVETTREFIQTNNKAFLNLLEACRHHPVKHLIFASSGSVYGVDTRMPFAGRSKTDHPVSLFAAIKRWNEMISRTYSSLFDIPVTGIRLFSVYGPWGRPDMACTTFTKSIIAGEPVEVTDAEASGHCFTYIDDVVESVRRLIPLVPAAEEDWRGKVNEPENQLARFRLLDMGHDEIISLDTFIGTLETGLGKTAGRKPVPAQPGTGIGIRPDLTQMRDLLGYTPQTVFTAGIKPFIGWYRFYYGNGG